MWGILSGCLWVSVLGECFGWVFLVGFFRVGFFIVGFKRTFQMLFFLSV